MKAVILAGGKGTRLAPYTTVLPKPLMPMGDMPILEVVLRQLRRSGVDHVDIAVGHLAELIRAMFGDGAKLGLDIAYSIEDKPLGTAGPLTLIGGLGDDTFLVMNGDILTTLDYADLVRHHKASGAAATIAMYTRQVKIDFGVLETDGHGRLRDIIEKPTKEYSVSMGIYVFEPRILKMLQHNERKDFPDLVKDLLAVGEHVGVYPFNGYWLDIGRPDDFARAVEEFEARRDEFLPGDRKQ
jgi:NDP-sugar pyrophosphorylase family protein